MRWSAALLVLAVLASPAAAARARDDSDAARAVAGYVAMQRAFFDVRTGSYRETPGATDAAHAWPVSQALAATIAVAGIPGANPEFARGARRRLASLEPLRAGPVYRAASGGDVYFDDNEWIAEDLLDWYGASRDPRALARSRAIFAAVTTAWDDEPGRVCPGGVRWTSGGVLDRNTVSTAGGALLGLRLYGLTRDRAYLDWSDRMLAWVDACLRGPDGLYWDHVGGDGMLDTRVWTYNQGLVIGAEVARYRVTHDRDALARAETLADAALAHFAPAALAVEPPEFAAIFFRHLLELAAADGRRQYVDAARAYADAAWAARDPRTGLLDDRLVAQGALTQLYAALALTASG